MSFRHGLGRTDYYILNDHELSFQEILRKKVGSSSASSSDPASDTKDAIKLERHEDILRFDKNEILVKLEKGEGTLKIEKVNVKKESPDKDKDKEKEQSEGAKIELTLVKSESESNEVEQQMEEKEKSEEAVKEVKEEECEEKKEEVSEAKEKTDEVEEVEKKEEVQDTSASAKEVSEEAKESSSEPTETTTTPETTESKEKNDEETVPKKEPETPEKDHIRKQLQDEADMCAKQAAELKAMFPDLEVIQPLSRLSQVDTFVLRDKQASGALDFSETTVAQIFNNAVKWPREYAIQVRLQHIVFAIETKEWPASKSFSAYANGIGSEFDVPIHEVPSEPPKRETSTPMSAGDSEIITITTDNLRRLNETKKRKRHIAIDVETERAKLHALLNSSHSGLPNPLTKPGMSWDNDDSEDSRRSTPIAQPLQPPPAHQGARVLSMPYDLKYHPPKTIGQTSVIPGTSSTLTPIDLSSRYVLKQTGFLRYEFSYAIRNS